MEPGVVIEEDHPHSPSGTSLRRAYAQDLAGLVVTLWGGSVSAFDVAADDDLVAPGGAFWTARRALVDAEPLGCAGARTLDAATVPGAAGVVELKRFFVQPAARGLGVGRALLAGAEGWARARGADVVVLDTSSRLTAAGRLYAAAGYVPVAAYNDNPYADVWLAKRLLLAG